jgi:hypothetical protein
MRYAMGTSSMRRKSRLLRATWVDMGSGKELEGSVVVVVGVAILG